jgi:pyruvate/2-oxoglutarate dehydrogenase complex dihydrolipoamide dehydrogenase (E3) component
LKIPLIFVQLISQNGQEQTISARYILIAVGGRPLIPAELSSVKEHILTSDDIFMRR